MKSFIKHFLISLLPIRLYLILRWYDMKINRKSDFQKSQNKRLVCTNSGYSYKPFDDKKAIFVHIPKCAGISINKALFGNLAGGHKTLDDYLIIFEPHNFTYYFKFTFVRNPWDRLVSAYKFLEAGGFNDGDRKFFERELSHFSDFNDFVRNWLNSENIFKYHHFKPQKFFIIDKFNKVTVDYIGYFENINEDFNYIAKKLDVLEDLSKVNAVQRNDYREFYEEDTIKIVADVYKDDIEAFNYNFNGVTKYVRKIL